MGNYMDTCIQRKQTEEDQTQVEQEKQEAHEDEKAGGGGNFNKASTMRIKLVMTKEELGWLLLQLQNKQGNKIDVLREIEKGRSVKYVEEWKPSLESIMESPEVLEMDRQTMIPS